MSKTKSAKEENVRIVKLNTQSVQPSKNEKHRRKERSRPIEAESDSDSEQFVKEAKPSVASDDTESDSTEESIVESDEESVVTSSEEENKEENEESDSELSISTTDILSSDPLYFILSQFFLTEDQKSITTVLEEINQKLGELVVSAKSRP